MKRIIVSIAVLIINVMPFYAQEKQSSSSEKHSRHSISLAIAHTHVPRGLNGINNGEALIIPAWGLNYDFHFNEHWAIGWHNEMEIATYIIRDAEGDEIERERPIITSLMATFKPGKYLSFLAGFGREIETHQSYWVIRLGLDVEIEINESWALSPAIGYDLKETVYDSWSIGLTTIKKF